MKIFGASLEFAQTGCTYFGCVFGCVFWWMADHCLVAPSNLHKGLLVAMRVWVLDNDGPTPHVVGVIM